MRTEVAVSCNPELGMLGNGERRILMLAERKVDPVAILKNPMILIGIVGFAFVIGMPYLMDNSMFSPRFSVP